MDNAYWNVVDAHIKRHECGCWTWAGAPLDFNVYRFVAESCGAPLPSRQKLYRMPDCKLGKECVNPNHLGTGRDFVLALKGQREEISPNAVTVKLTPQDERFLKALKIGWK